MSNKTIGEQIADLEAMRVSKAADMEAVTERMQALADAAPEGVRAELEVNPTNML